MSMTEVSTDFVPQPPLHAKQRFPSITILNRLWFITDKTDIVIWAGEFMSPNHCPQRGRELTMASSNL